MSDDRAAVEVIPPDDPRAVRVAAIMRPEAFKLVRDPLAAFTFELPAFEWEPFEWP